MPDRDGSADVVVIGGAVIGSAAAYFLTRADSGFDGRVVIVERDPTFAGASTALSASGIRHQFSNPINVAISRFGTAFIKAAPDTLGVDLGFHEQGYLFLAATAEQEETLRANHAVQTSEGADVALLNRNALAARFPHLRVDDIRLASLGLSGEGWFDNTGLMTALRTKAREAGAEIVTAEAVAIDRTGGRVDAVHLSDGRRIACGWVINASGPRAARTAAMAGVSVPVEPRKRTVFAFACQSPPPGRLPLMIDPTGLWVRPEGAQFIAGCPPPDDPAVAFDDFDPDYALFEDVVWPTLADRAPCFEAIKMTRAWAGHYAMNTLDHNVVVGPHPEVANFLFANGFSGHGLQQGPAVGRGLAEWIAYGGYRSLDLTPLGYDRVAAGRPFLERAVI
jgi:glycine/D-amino acid oxidase-like deaminating enzyme